MLRRAARFLIAIALLVGQQAAIAHQVWHLGKQDSQPQNQLCEQHCALATVAGALDCISLEAPLLATCDAPLRWIASVDAPAPYFAPTSRGPPKPLA